MLHEHFHELLTRVAVNIYIMQDGVQENEKILFDLISLNRIYVQTHFVCVTNFSRKPPDSFLFYLVFRLIKKKKKRKTKNKNKKKKKRKSQLDW